MHLGEKAKQKEIVNFMRRGGEGLVWMGSFLN